jgi:hypothetical protein
MFEPEQKLKYFKTSEYDLSHVKFERYGFIFSLYDHLNYPTQNLTLCLKFRLIDYNFCGKNSNEIHEKISRNFLQNISKIRFYSNGNLVNKYNFDLQPFLEKMFKKKTCILFETSYVIISLPILFDFFHDKIYFIQPPFGLSKIEILFKKATTYIPKKMWYTIDKYDEHVSFHSETKGLKSVTKRYTKKNYNYYPTTAIIALLDDINLHQFETKHISIQYKNGLELVISIKNVNNYTMTLNGGPKFMRQMKDVINFDNNNICPKLSKDMWMYVLSKVWQKNHRIFECCKFFWNSFMILIKQNRIFPRVNFLVIPTKGPLLKSYVKQKFFEDKKIKRSYYLLVKRLDKNDFCNKSVDDLNDHYLNALNIKVKFPFETRKIYYETNNVLVHENFQIFRSCI